MKYFKLLNNQTSTKKINLLQKIRSACCFRSKKINTSLEQDLDSQEIDQHPQQIIDQNVFELFEELSNNNHRHLFPEQNDSNMFYKKSVLISTTMIVTLSTLLFAFTFLLRKGQNRLIPFALIFQSTPFLALPLIIIFQNPNLKKFIVNEFSAVFEPVIAMAANGLALFKIKVNQTHPFVTVV